MRLEIDLSPELQARLQHVAAGLGMDVSEYIGRLVRSNLAPAQAQAPVQAQATAPVASVARAAAHAPAYAHAHANAAAPAPVAHAAPARQPVSVPLAAGPVPFSQEPAGPDLSELAKKFSAQV